MDLNIGFTRIPSLIEFTHISVLCLCLIGPRVETPIPIWANQILSPRELNTQAHRDQAVGVYGIHYPGNKVQEALLMRTLKLRWLFRFPFDSVNYRNGLHLERLGVNSVVSLQRSLVGKNSCKHHPSPIRVLAHYCNFLFLFAQVFLYTRSSMVSWTVGGLTFISPHAYHLANSHTSLRS